MSHRIIILKNTTASDIEFLGETVPAFGQSDFSHIAAIEMAEEDVLITAINAGDIVVNNGTDDLTVSNGILYVSSEFTLSILVDGAPLTAPVTYVNSLNFVGGIVVVDEETGAISVESGNAIGDIQKDDVTIVSDVNIMNFEGDVTVVDDTNGKATITVNTNTDRNATITWFHSAGTENVWLSLEEHHARPSGPSTDSTSEPAIMPFDGAVYALDFINEANSSESDIEFYVNSVLTFTWEIRDKKWAYKTNGLSAFTFSAGDKISVYAKKVTGEKPVSPVIHMYFKFTSTTTGEGGGSTL